ncbi:hypothetical protein AgCh_001745 [Apium graveolens]
MFEWTEKCENSFQELKQRLVMAPMLALPDGKGDFVKCSDASHKGLGCVLMQHGKKELNICHRRQLELIKNNDWEILYHSGKANVVADALSKKERLKMIMSLGEFIRDFGNSSEGELDTRCMDSVWLAIKTSWKMNDYSRTKLSKIEAAEKKVVKLWWYSEWKHIHDTKVEEVIKRLERNWNDHLTRIEFLTTIDHMSLSRCHLMRSLREDNVDLPYVRMKCRAQDAQTSSGPKDQGYNRSNQRTAGLMRFGKKGKLSPPIVGPLDILRSIGKLAYELALPQNM